MPRSSLDDVAADVASWQAREEDQPELARHQWSAEPKDLSGQVHQVSDCEAVLPRSLAARAACEPPT